MRWTRERSGAAVVGLAGVFVAGGMGGESTALGASDKGSSSNIHGRELEVHLTGGGLTGSPGFAGLSPTRSAGRSKCPGVVGPALTDLTESLRPRPVARSHAARR